MFFVYFLSNSKSIITEVIHKEHTGY